MSILLLYQKPLVSSPLFLAKGWKFVSTTRKVSQGGHGYPMRLFGPFEPSIAVSSDRANLFRSPELPFASSLNVLPTPLAPNSPVPVDTNHHHHHHHHLLFSIPQRPPNNDPLDPSSCRIPSIAQNIPLRSSPRTPTSGNLPCMSRSIDQTNILPS